MLNTVKVRRFGQNKLKQQQAIASQALKQAWTSQT